VLVEIDVRIEYGRVIHGHLCAKLSVGQIRPIANVRIPDAHNIWQTVTTHISQIDGLSRIREQYPGSGFLGRGKGDTTSSGEAIFSSALIPNKGIILGYQYVRLPISGEVDESEIRVCSVQYGPQIEWLKRLESGGERRLLIVQVVRVTVEASSASNTGDQAHLAVALQVHQAETRSGLVLWRLGGNLQRSECG